MPRFTPGGTENPASALAAGSARAVSVMLIAGVMATCPSATWPAVQKEPSKEAVRKSLEDNDRLDAAAIQPTPPARFPVTQFDVPDRKATETPLVVVLDDSDEDFKEKRTHHDVVRMLFKSESGVRTTLLRDFNTCQTVGAVHGVAVDTVRGRIYIREQVSHRVTALDFHGRTLWQVNNIQASALAVDPKTGHLWCAVGKSLAVGETVELDTTGHEFTSFPVKGFDIAHDPHTDGFWLVGYGITKLSREGKILFQKPQEGWACVSVAANPRDGSVWIVERAHPNFAGSANRLWHLGANGTTIKTWELGDKLIFGVACEPNTGTAWVVSLGGEVLRFTMDGRELPALPVSARAISISPSTGQVWVTTDIEILQLDSGGRPKTLGRFESKSGQSWLAAF